MFIILLKVDIFRYNKGMNTHDPKTILENAHTIAVLGVNKDPDAFANKIVRKIKSLNKLPYPINPKYEELFGEKVYPSLTQTPNVPDLVVFVVNPTIGIQYLDTVKALGHTHIWLQPGTVDDALLTKAKQLGLFPIEACVLVVGNYLAS